MFFNLYSTSFLRSFLTVCLCLIHKTHRAEEKTLLKNPVCMQGSVSAAEEEEATHFIQSYCKYCFTSEEKGIFLKSETNSEFSQFVS